MADATPQAASTPPAEGTLVTNAPAAQQTPAPDQGGSLIGQGAPPPSPATPPAPPEVKPTVPEKYELKLSENSPLKAEHLEKVAAFAKERGLSNEQAQGLVDRDQASYLEYQANSEVMRRAQVQDWVTQVKADQEIGNLNFDRTVADATRMVDRFGTPALKDALNKSGFGNHPELIRFVSRIAKTMSDDSMVMPNQNAQQKPRDLAEVLYPKK